MRPTLYRFLVSLHPRPFRERFGPEMMEIFNHEIKRGGTAKLLLDGVASAIRQRFLRARAPDLVLSPVGLVPTSDVPGFRILDSTLPRRGMLVNGGLATTCLLFGLGFAASRGPGGWSGMLIGAKYPRPLVLPVDRASIVEAEPTTEVKIVSPEPDPLDGIARVYFGVVRVLKSLDANGDRIISAWEVVTARSALRRLIAMAMGNSTLQNADSIRTKAPSLRWRWSL